eukprot:SAG31_NODE_2745_length_5147_cov_20.624604_6_plen_125_part_00
MQFSKEAAIGSLVLIDGVNVVATVVAMLWQDKVRFRSHGPLTLEPIRLLTSSMCTGESSDVAHGRQPRHGGDASCTCAWIQFGGSGNFSGGGVFPDGIRILFLVNHLIICSVNHRNDGAFNAWT